MKLSAPKQITWWIAVIVAAVSALSQYGVLKFNLGDNYALMLIAFVIMLLGTMLKGL